jgi:hypothetical protein
MFDLSKHEDKTTIKQHLGVNAVLKPALTSLLPCGSNRTSPYGLILFETGNVPPRTSSLLRPPLPLLLLGTQREHARQVPAQTAIGSATAQGLCAQEFIN